MRRPAPEAEGMGIFAAERNLARHLSTHRQFPSLSRPNLLKLFGREIDGNRP